QLLILADRLGARTGGLPAHVDERGAFGGHAHALLHRRLHRDEAAAVGEGVGRDVQHAHDHRAGEIEGLIAATQLQCWPAGIGPPPAAGPSAGACGGLLDSASSQPAGGLGILPAMRSFSCSSSMVSYFMSASAIVCSLSRELVRIWRARWQLRSLTRRICSSMACAVTSETCLCCVTPRPRHAS